MEASDVALLERWNLFQDAEAFPTLVARHSPMVYGTRLRLLHNETDAADTAQDCFIVLMQRGPEAHRHHTSLGGWLHTVATRQSLNRRRAEARRLTRETSFAGSQRKTAGGTVHDVQLHMDAVIADLPAELRDPLVAHFLQGQSHQAIADASGVPRQTITNRIARGIEAVRSGFRKQGISITASALASVFTAESTYAVPQGLTATLSQLARAGGAGIPSGITVTAMGGALAMKTAFALGAGILAVVVGTWYLLTRSEERQAISPNPTTIAPVSALGAEATARPATGARSTESLSAVSEAAASPSAIPKPQRPSGTQGPAVPSGKMPNAGTASSAEKDVFASLNAFFSAGTAGDSQAAAEVALPEVAKQAVQLGQLTNESGELPFDIYIQGNNALAVSSLVQTPKPNQPAGYLVFTFVKSGQGKWLVADVDLEESEQAALAELERFQDAPSH